MACVCGAGKRVRFEALNHAGSLNAAVPLNDHNMMEARAMRAQYPAAGLAAAVPVGAAP